MINLQLDVSVQEHSGSFFVFGILLPKWNELHDAFCFHFCPFVSLFNFFSIDSLSISHLFLLTCRYRNNEHENDSTNSLGLDFERVIYVGEFSINEDMEDDDLSSDLLRLVVQDEKQI